MAELGKQAELAVKQAANSAVDNAVAGDNEVRDAGDLAPIQTGTLALSDGDSNGSGEREGFLTAFSFLALLDGVVNGRWDKIMLLMPEITKFQHKKNKVAHFLTELVSKYYAKNLSNSTVG